MSEETLSKQDIEELKASIEARLDELGARMNTIEVELDQPKSKDLGEQAIDLEDDEVLERLGSAAEREVEALRQALNRVSDGSFGVCARCGDGIAKARLLAVPYAVLCQSCAMEKSR